MSDSKRQSIIMIGIALLLLSGLLLYFSLSQPRISEQDMTEASTVLSSVYQTTGSSVINASYPVNINSCTAEELMTVNGIGESKASAIIEYRNYIGGYTSVDQIKNIKGIGDSFFNSVAPYLCV